MFGHRRPGIIRPIHPALLSGCVMSFDAWDATSLTIVNTNQVSAWKDTISNVSLTQGTAASRPTTDGNFVNSDGSDDNLAYTAGSISGWPTSGDVEYVGLVNCLSANGDSGTKTLFEYPNSGINGFSLRRVVVSSQNTLGSSVGTGSIAATYTHRNVAFTGKCVIRYRHPGGSVPTFWLDDNALSPSPTASTMSLSGATRYRLFATAGTSAGAFGYFGINLLAGFSRLLTDAEWRRIRAYLRARRRVV